jgi:hypothetical protein
LLRFARNDTPLARSPALRYSEDHNSGQEHERHRLSDA